MKRITIILVLLFMSQQLFSNTITVGNLGDYPNLNGAVDVAMPGDTIKILEGVYSGGLWINKLCGEEDKRIVIIAEKDKDVLFVGGNNAIQFSDCCYMKISGLQFREQKGNGVNIDDGGDYSTPTHHIIIENCIWHNMDASGNNDELKLSGLDDFEIRNCLFLNGSPGGSLIDMVGCHRGIIENCRFENAGSNCIQAKGGSEGTVIRYNTFINGGQRSINIGGSTGEPYFRPLDAPYEAANMLIHSNIFIGSVAPLAFVGAIQSKAINNTIVFPGKWAIRILQENNNDGISKCSNNEVTNNIFYLNANSVKPAINIGDKTQPETFVFNNNLWFNADDPAWRNPNIPVEELNGIKGQDPLFFDSVSDFRLNANSPAIGKGKKIDYAVLDFEGNAFKNPPSIGAFEGNPSIESIEDRNYFNTQIVVFPNPCTESFYIISPNVFSINNNFELIDAKGGIVSKDLYSYIKINDFTSLITFMQKIPSGMYLLSFKTNYSSITKKILID